MVDSSSLFRDIRIEGALQAQLACTLSSGHSRGPVLFAHGFGQTRGAWTSSAQQLHDAGFQTLSYDARGHGDSDWNTPELRYDGQQFVDDLIVLAGEQAQPPVLVAASMGGLFGLLAEARWPGLFSAMVLVDITPRWDTAGVERILGFMSAHRDGFDSLAAAADSIASYLPHRPRKSEDALRAVLRQRADGRWLWHWDPRMVEEFAANADQHQDALALAAARVQCPLMLISGGRSDLVTADNVSEFLSLVPHAQHVELADATHMLAGDDNNAFTSAVLNYLGRLPAVFPQAHHPFEHVTGARP
jgi:pimeloyl-ACP methyl ester carboxylesterase